MLERASFSPIGTLEDYSDLIDFNFDDLIRTTWNTSFLTAVLYRKSKTLPSDIEALLDRDVVGNAKLCSAWDCPGGGVLS